MRLLENCSDKIIRDNIPENECGHFTIEKILKEYYNKQGKKLVHLDINASSRSYQHYGVHIDDKNGEHHHVEIDLIR